MAESAGGPNSKSNESTAELPVEVAPKIIQRSHCNQSGKDF